MESKEPTKINAERNNLGISFDKSPPIEPSFSNPPYNFSLEISLCPVLNPPSTISHESSLLKDLVPLESTKILIDIEPPLKIKILSIDVQILNTSP